MRRTAVLALSSALVLFGCGGSDDAEELTARTTTTSPSISTTSSTTTTTTVPPTTVPRTAATRPPATTAAPEEAPSPGNCSPAYPSVCIAPPPPDLDCPEIPYKRFTVLPPDPHGFDGNDNDGIGCER